MTIPRLNCQEQFEQSQTDHEVAKGRKPKVKQLIYDLHPCKSPFRPLSAFKFDPSKFSLLKIHRSIVINKVRFEQSERRAAVLTVMRTMLYQDVYVDLFYMRIILDTYHHP
jgi:1,4-alpha-glucan branching enzyme